MALLFIDGFDMYSTSSNMAPGKWDAVSGTITYTTGRLGINKCAYYQTSASYTEKTIANKTTLYCGFAIKLQSSPSTETFFQGMEGGIFNFKVRINTSRYIEILDSAGAIQDTGTTPLSVGVWYYIEVKCVIGNTGSVEVKLEGNVEASAVSIDTQQGSNSYVDAIRLYGNTAGIYFDDFYVLDNSGSTNNTYLGDSRVDPFLPTADSAVQWTPSTGIANYAMVDDALADGDSTYVYSSTTGNKDYYDFAEMAVGTGTVYGVQVVANARKMDAGTKNFKLKIKSGVTEQESSSLPLSTSYIDYCKVFETSDGVSTAWNKTLVDAAQIGIEVV